MKKFILNISDIDFERLRLEALEKRCDIATIVKDRMFAEPFSDIVEQTIDRWISDGVGQMLREVK